MKLKWLKTLTINDNANWKIIPKFFLNQYGDNFLILKMNIDSLKSLPVVKYVIPSFYKEILTYHIQINNLNIKPKLKTFHEIRTQVIRGNCFIKYKGTCLLFSSWINSGIIFINDVIDDKGEIKETLVNKLQNKVNWISEIAKLKYSIPKLWKKLLKSEASIKSTVKTNTNHVFGINCYISKLNNTDINRKFIAKKFETPYMHSYWKTTFKLVF